MGRPATLATYRVPASTDRERLNRAAARAMRDDPRVLSVAWGPLKGWLPPGGDIETAETRVEARIYTDPPALPSAVIAPIVGGALAREVNWNSSLVSYVFEDVTEGATDVAVDTTETVIDNAAYGAEKVGQNIFRQFFSTPLGIATLALGAYLVVRLATRARVV